MKPLSHTDSLRYEGYMDLLEGNVDLYVHTRLNQRSCAETSADEEQ